MLRRSPTRTALIRAAIISVGVSVVALSPALAKDKPATVPDVTITGGVGVVQLTSNELVYDDFGNRLSQLIWSTAYAPVLNAGLRITAPSGWLISASTVTGMGGDSFMQDYDWLRNDYTFDNWSDRSVSPDTRLELYFSGEVKVGHTVISSDVASLGLSGGFRYNTVRWSAYGGSYVYSEPRFRDTVGDFPDGERGITFEQQLPVAFVGADLTAAAGPWSLSGSAQLGVTVSGVDVDNHWLRDLLFTDTYQPTPVVAASGTVGYKVTENLGLSVTAGFDKVLLTKVDTLETDLTTGAQYFFPNSAGGDFASSRLSVEVDGHF